MHNSRILITGGAGFIGSNAARLFHSLQNEILIVDNLSRAQMASANLSAQTNHNWNVLSKLDNVKCLKEDVRDFECMKKIFRDYQPEIIIHTAGQTAVTTSLTNPKLDFDINAAGTFSVLEAARQADLSPIIIYCSTNKVFGESPNKCQIIEKETRYEFSDKSFRGFSPETAIDRTCHSPYGTSKLCGDLYVQEYGQIYGFLTGVFRMSCIYGINQFGLEDQGWVSHFIISMLNNRNLNIYGDGKQVRDILYIDDLLAVYKSYIEKAKSLGSQVYTIGGGIENTISVIECLDFLKTKFDYKGTIEYKPWRAVDQKVYVSDISKAEKELSWKPKISAHEGIGKLVNWTIENKDIFLN